MRRTSLMFSLLLSPLAFAAFDASAVTIRVGSDSSCDYYFLPQALAAAKKQAGQVEIRLARNIKHSLATDGRIGPNITFTGGYSNCHDQTALGVTTLEVTTTAAASAVAQGSSLRGVRVRGPQPADAMVDAGRR